MAGVGRPVSRNKPEDEELLEMYREHTSVEMARTLGVAPRTVQKWVYAARKRQMEAAVAAAAVMTPEQAKMLERLQGDLKRVLEDMEDLEETALPEGVQGELQWHLLRDACERSLEAADRLVMVKE